MLFTNGSATTNFETAESKEGRGAGYYVGCYFADYHDTFRVLGD